MKLGSLHPGSCSLATVWDGFSSFEWSLVYMCVCMYAHVAGVQTAN